LKYFHTRIKQLRTLLDTYQYPQPFSAHLKLFFQKNKNLGGKDRKEIRALAYGFFRLSGALEGKSFEEMAAVAADFIDTPLTVDHFLETVPGAHPDKVFPFSEYVSDLFKNTEFQNSFLSQPKVWFRIQPGMEQKVVRELHEADISFESYDSQVKSVQSEEKLTQLKSFQDGSFHIQDLSSQQTADFFKPGAGETWWDCCAGSGGKSLGLLEREKTIHLYASDIRESILNNLVTRLANIAPAIKPNIFAADVSKPLDQELPVFDGIIIDASCSGSGTWARNPENLYYFKPGAIADYATRQLSILENVYPRLKPGKPLIYITCSVFKGENEAVIEAFAQKNNVQIEEQKYFEGYKQSAENMFLCRMIKSN
jgi:16S rRNA (cytosine967-C5)-methyltransferase